MQSDYFYLLILAAGLIMVLTDNIKVTASVFTIVYLLLNVRKNKVTLDYQPNKINDEMIKKCPSLKTYNPTIYLNGFLHTLIASVMPKDKNLTSTRELINTTGISVDWVCRNKDNKQLLFLLPGLTGKIQDSYINAQVKEAIKKGFQNICVYNYRVLSKEADYFFCPEDQNYGLNLVPNQFNAEYKSNEFAGIDNDFHFLTDECVDGSRLRVDLVADLHYTLSYIKDKYNFEKIGAVGCSYGATQLCNYLGRYEDKALVNSAVSIGPPYSMVICNRKMTYCMDRLITSLLQRNLRAIKPLFDKGHYPKNWDIDVEKALKATKVSEFDKYFSSRVYGYKTVDSYYRHFSPINKMNKIKVPLLCISSYDDSVCHWKGICKDEILLNENAILCMTGLGGHIGFVEGFIPNKIWFPRPAMEFIQATLI